MRIIDPSYFIVDISIPNRDSNPDREILSSFIDKFEPICLKSILGTKLFLTLKVQMNADNLDGRMTDLVEGVDYVDKYGKDRVWIGLRQKDQQTSLVAYYVYYFYTQKTAVSQTGIGAHVVIVPKGGVVISPQEKMVAAWNNFSKEVEQLSYFLWSNLSVYPEVDLHILSSNSRIFRRTNIFGI